MTLPRLAEMKLNAEPIVMVTAYDFPSAEIAEAAGVDLVLCGDTAAMTMLGHSSTTPVSLDEMLVLAKAVRRGLRTPLLVGDLPFGSYERSNEQAIESAMRYVKEAGCDVVKLERGGVSVERVRAIVRAGIPVMGHVGLTPQTATALGGFKAQGRTADQAVKIAEEALALQAAGCFSIVFEAVPAAISEVLVPKLAVPVIGIGAGAGDRRPGARLARPARDLRRPSAEVREALRVAAGADGRWRRGVRPGGPRARVPGPGARLRDRRSRAGGVPTVSRPGEPGRREHLRRRLVGHRDLSPSAQSRTTVHGMSVQTTEIRISTSGDSDVVDISRELSAAVAASGVGEGQASAFIRGSTAAITTMEFEPGGVHDLRAALERLIPTHGDYEHNRLNHDSNSHAHQRATIVGASEVIPVTGGRPALGHLAAVGADRLRRPPA